MPYVIVMLVLVIGSAVVYDSTQASTRQYAGEEQVTENVGGDGNVIRFYDSELKVWCWKSGVNQGGISCIPEWQIEDPYSRVDPNETPDNEG